MISRVFKLFIFAVVGRLCVAQDLTLPLKICHRNASNYSSCLRDAIQEAWPLFVGGLPELHFPILDPLLYENYHAIFDTDIIHLNVEAINITVIGMANYQFLNVETYFTDDICHFKINIRAPQIFCKGILKSIGSLGPFRMNTTGHFNLTITDNTIKFIIAGRVANDRWNIKQFRIIPTMKKVKIYLDDFFDSKELDDLIHIFVNEHWPALYRVTAPTVINAWEPWLVENINKIFSKVSFSKIFPE